MQQVATKALSAEAGTQNHRTYNNVPLHRTKSPYVHWVTDHFPTSLFHGGVETDFGARSRRRNRPRLARLLRTRFRDRY